MLSEDFDKKIRDAADHHHPAYDENGWKEMKKLLDKHMPEEEERKRRILFFLLLFLLLGGGATWFFVGQISGKKEKGAPVTAISQPVEKKDQPRVVQDESNHQPVDPAGDPSPAKDVESTGVKTGDQDPNANPTGIDRDADVGLINHNGEGKKVIAKKQPAEKKNVVKGDVTVKNNDNNRKRPGDDPLSKAPVLPADNPGMTDNKKSAGDPGNSSTVPVVKTNEPQPVIVKARPVTPEAKEEKPKEQGKNEAAKKEEKTPDKKIKIASKKKSSFFFSVSGGPDVSFTGNDKLGRMEFMGGGGIGYTFKEKFTLRTGFYSVRKVYDSSPEQYHGSSRFYFYYPNLQKVEADCKVYEIPVSLSYNFGAKGKHSWFASAGVSTLLMKRETYDYYFKYYASNPTVNHRTRTIRNANEHYFSMLTLSMGYQQKIGRKFSVIAEPYFKTPFTGIGSGGVKLNSSGVIFTLTMNPFQKTEKKK